jgi:hypothetical protein
VFSSVKLTIHLEKDLKKNNPFRFISGLHYFQAITGDVVVSRFQRSRNLMEQSLGQIQTMVPVILAAEVCHITVSRAFLLFFLFFAAVSTRW